MERNSEPSAQNWDPTFGSELFRGESSDRFGLDSPVRNVISFLTGGFGDFVTIEFLTRFFLFSPLIWSEEEKVRVSERMRVLLGFPSPTHPL